MAMTESDLDTKVWKKSMASYYWWAKNELSMRSCSWNIADSNKPILDLPNWSQVLYMTIQRNIPRFCMGTICGWNHSFSNSVSFKLGLKACMLFSKSIVVREGARCAWPCAKLTSIHWFSTLSRRGRHHSDRLVILRREKQWYFSEKPTQDQRGSNPGCMHDRRGEVTITANTRHSPNALLMLRQRLRRWPNIETALSECLG